MVGYRDTQYTANRKEVSGLSFVFVKATLILILSVQSMPFTPSNSYQTHMVLKGVPMALKIVFQICCGIDVHKTFVVACISSTNSKGVTTYKRHRFSTFTSGLKALLQWRFNNNCKDVYWQVLDS